MCCFAVMGCYVILLILQLCSHLMLTPTQTFIGPKGYFLIIDRLNETLDTRIKRWKKEKRKALSKNGKKKRETVVTKGLKTLATKRLSAEDISRQESMANYNGEISEDQKHQDELLIQDITNNIIHSIDDILSNKETSL